MEEHNQNNEFSRKVFEQLMDIFIAPEVKRRQETGELDKPLQLKAAQVIFFPDGRKPKVRINSEVKAIAKIKLKPGISKRAGEYISEHEIEGLEKLNLTEDDPDCGHVTLLQIDDRWTITFDFRYNINFQKSILRQQNNFMRQRASLLIKEIGQLLLTIYIVLLSS